MRNSNLRIYAITAGDLHQARQEALSLNDNNPEPTNMLTPQLSDLSAVASLDLSSAAVHPSAPPQEPREILTPDLLFVAELPTAPPQETPSPRPSTSSIMYDTPHNIPNSLRTSYNSPTTPPLSNKRAISEVPSPHHRIPKINSSEHRARVASLKIDLEDAARLVRNTYPNNTNFLNEVEKISKRIVELTSMIGSHELDVHFDQAQQALTSLKGMIDLGQQTVRVLAKIAPAKLTNGRNSCFSPNNNAFEEARVGLGSIRHKFDKIYDADRENNDDTEFFVQLTPALFRLFRGLDSSVILMGRSNTGKSVTMMGKPNSKNRGILFRAIDECIKKENELGGEIFIQISEFLTTRRDLLQAFHTAYKPVREEKRKKAHIGKNKIFDHILPLKTSDPFGPDRISLRVNASQPVSEAIKGAIKLRSTDEGSENDVSSRTHLCITLIYVNNDKVACFDIFDMCGNETADASLSSSADTRTISNQIFDLWMAITAKAERQAHSFNTSILKQSLNRMLAPDANIIVVLTLKLHSTHDQTNRSNINRATKITGSLLRLRDRAPQPRPQTISRLPWFRHGEKINLSHGPETYTATVTAYMIVSRKYAAECWPFVKWQNWGKGGWNEWASPRRINCESLISTQDELLTSTHSDTEE